MAAPYDGGGFAPYPPGPPGGPVTQQPGYPPAPGYPPPQGAYPPPQPGYGAPAPPPAGYAPPAPPGGQGMGMAPLNVPPGLDYLLHVSFDWNFSGIQNFEIFCEKNRQNEGRSAPLS